MKKKNVFTLGAIAGIGIVALAVPLLAQVTSAAPASLAASPRLRATGIGSFNRPAPTQQQIEDMVARDDAFLQNIDAFVSVLKSATQTHRDALSAAASVTDDSARQAAVQKANVDERTAIQNALTANPDLKPAMMSFGGAPLDSARGLRQDLRPLGGRGFGEGKGGPGMMGRGRNTAALATKLGMTEADLKAALASGKTIQQIAEEHGVTLPARMGKHRGWMMGNGASDGNASSTSSAQ